jgi:tetratricopeptide (TPR) repeat protein
MSQQVVSLLRPPMAAAIIGLMVMTACAGLEQPQEAAGVSPPKAPSREAVQEALPSEDEAKFKIETAQSARANRIAPTNEAYYFYIESQLARNRGELDRAVNFLQDATQHDPQSAFLKQELAELHMSRKEYSKALEVINQALARDDQNAGSLVLKARALIALEQPEVALPILEQVIRIDPEDEQTYLLLGSLYAQLENYADAQKVYTELVARFPDSVPGYYYLGKTCAARKSYNDAETAFNRVRELAPELEEPRLELIKLYEATGQPQKSERIYQELIDLNPEDLAIQLDLALHYYRHGKKTSAMQMLETVPVAEGDDPRLISTIAQSYIEPERYADALVIIKMLLTRDPQHDGLNYLAGLAYDGLQKPEEVTRYFKKVRSDSRFFANAVMHVGFIIKENDLPGAVVYLTDAINKAPENTDLWLFLATILEDDHQYAAAMESIEAGLAISPKGTDLLFRLGVLQDKSSQKDNSINTMQQVIELDPKHVNALNYLGYTYAEMGQNLDEAEQLINRALTLKPDDGYITDSLGWVYYQKGLYQKALEVLLSALELVPDDPTILEHIGDAYVKNQKFELALVYYRRALEQKNGADKATIERKIQELSELVTDQ